MADKSVSILAGLLNEDVQTLEQKLESEEGQQEIEGKVKKLTVMETDKFTAREQNIEAEIKQKLKEDARQGKLDPEIYNTVANNIISKQDKELAAKFGVEDFTSHEDLVTKIKSLKVEDEGLKSDLEKLRQRNKELAEEAKTKESEAEKRINDYQISQLKTKLVDSFPYDYENEEQAKLRKWNAESIINGNYKFGVVDGKQVIIDEDGNPLKDPDTREFIDPVKRVHEDLKKVIPYKKDAEPGKGGNREPGKQPTGKMSLQEFNDKMDKEGVMPNSDKYFNELDKMQKQKLIE
jgi:hypothetical protein